MNLTLNPPSGYADSYLDVEFSATIKPYPKSIVRLFNDVSGEQLDILGVSFGYILNGNEAVSKNKSSITGHINIFNQDKMNKKFMSHRNVPVKCVVDYYDEHDVEIGSEEETLLFYNEAYSLDAGIIPFDLRIHNPTINTDKHDPLVIDIISGKQRKFGLCIASLDKSIRCPIEITAKEGKTTVEVPGAFLFYDLDLAVNAHRKFQFFYAKYQGTTYSRMANRQYLPIQNSDIEFVSSGRLRAMPQSRLDPIKRQMGKEFVISHRYLVFCPSESSGFARKSEFGAEKLMDLTMMINEGQNMKAISRQVQQFASDETAKIGETKQSIQTSRHHASKDQIKPNIPFAQIQLMKSISKTYDNISLKGRQNPKVHKATAPEKKTVRSFSGAQPQKKRGCASCSRKKKANA